MKDYLKEDRKKAIKKDATLIFILILITLCVILAYILYEKTQIGENNINLQNNTSGTTIERTMQTVEQAQEKSKTVTEMIANIKNTVVGISKVKNNGSSIFMQENITSLGLGSGVIVTEDGYILSNAHVSGEKYSKCYVTLSNGETFDGNVVWSNTDIDMSIIKINQKNLNVAKLGNSDDIQAGESVFAIGNPIGFEFQRTVTAGIVSATNRTIKLEEEEQETYMEDLIQTDATINPRK